MVGRRASRPDADRMVPFAGHPAVVGVVPGQPGIVALTALSWARAVGAPALHFAYADPTRFVVEEFPDGSVRHAPIESDATDDDWEKVRDGLVRHVAGLLAGAPMPWHLHYLAGRPDRALTQLARTVDAAVIIVGTRLPGAAARLHELLEGSVAGRIAHHQHRPVLTVPLSAVDWTGS